MTIMIKQDKTLLLLGILRSHQSHGYELNALLESPVVPIRIGKANAYQILSQLEARGWVTSTEERQGNRPPRRVYAVTPAGEAEFERLLRKRLAVHIPDDHADAVSLNFLSELPPDEGVALLSERLHAVQQRLDDLRAQDVEGAEVHYGLDCLLKHAQLERDWLQALVNKLSGEVDNTT
jgi:DNA-binding PadR family transcriptional regulator